MELRPKLEGFDSSTSEDFSIHTISSNRNSIKTVLQQPIVSNKRIFGFIINLTLGTAIIVDLYCWHLNTGTEKTGTKLKPQQANESLAAEISTAISEVKALLENSWLRTIDFKKNESYFKTIHSPSDKQTAMEYCPENYVLSKGNCYDIQIWTISYNSYHMNHIIWAI